MIKARSIGIILGIFLLAACSTGHYKNLEANDSNVFSPKLAIEKRSDDGKLVSLSLQSFSAQDDGALELNAASAGPAGSSSSGQPADVFMYEGAMLRGAELGDTETNNPRVFSADARYDSLEAGFYGWWGNDSIAFVPGLLVELGRATIDVTEVGVESDPAHLSIETDDVSVGFSLGVAWDITDKLHWGTHFAMLEGLNDAQSVRFKSEIKYPLTNHFMFSYGLYSLNWEDSSASTVTIDRSAHQFGLIYSF